MPVLIRTACSCSIPEARLQRTAGFLLRAIGRPGAELSLLLVHDVEMARLNGKWLGRPWPTNVISFEQGGPGAHGADILGDIVICVDAARREAAETNQELHHRLEALLIHGLVHLLGEDHEQGPEAARRMAALEQALYDTLLGEKILAQLHINVDHVATLRQASGLNEPDPVLAAGLVELAGADGIVVHLREDRLHIQDRDVRLLRQTVKTRLNLEICATEEMIDIARGVRPDTVTLVPEGRDELTAEGGFDVNRLEGDLKTAVARLHEDRIPVSLLVGPEPGQIEAAQRTGAECIEIHAGRYAEAQAGEQEDAEFEQILTVARQARDLGLAAHTGRGLNYRNAARLAAVSEIEGLNIGHAVIARAVLVGIEQAVREMLRIVKQF